MPVIDLSRTPDMVAPKFHQLLKPMDARFVLLYGGAGASKSYSMAQALIYRCLLESGHKILVARKVARSLKNSVVALIMHIVREWGMRDLVTLNKTDNTLSFWSGSQIVFTGLDDVDKLRSIHGITDIWVEEADELTLGDFRQLNLRLRGKSKHKKLFGLTFNPVAAISWLKAEFFDNPKDNAKIIHATYKDNPFIDDEYKRELEMITDPYYRAVYVHGEWGELGNVVFTDYAVEHFTYTEDDMETVSQGLDFGYNHPSVAVRMGLRDGEVYVFDEVCLREVTNSQFIEAVKDLDPDYARHSYIADSAEPGRIKEFRNAGVPVQPAVKGKDSVRHGIDWLKRRRIHIHADRCPRLAQEIQGYKWREDRDGNTLDEPVAFFDDAIAALRYATEPLRRQSRWVPIDMIGDRS